MATVVEASEGSMRDVFVDAQRHVWATFARRAVVLHETAAREVVARAATVLREWVAEARVVGQAVAARRRCRLEERAARASIHATAAEVRARGSVEEGAALSGRVLGAAAESLAAAARRRARCDSQSPPLALLSSSCSQTSTRSPSTGGLPETHSWAELGLDADADAAAVALLQSESAEFASLAVHSCVAGEETTRAGVAAWQRHCRIGLLDTALEDEGRRLVLIGEARARCGLVGEADAALRLLHAVEDEQTSRAAVMTEEHDERAAAHASEEVSRPAVLPPDVDGVADRTSTSLDAALLSSSCSRSPSEEAFVFAELEDEADDGRWALLRSESAEFGALLAAHSCVVSEEGARIALTEDARLGLASLKQDAHWDEVGLIEDIFEDDGRGAVVDKEAEARCALQLEHTTAQVSITAHAEITLRGTTTGEEHEAWEAVSVQEREQRITRLLSETEAAVDDRAVALRQWEDAAFEAVLAVHHCVVGEETARAALVSDAWSDSTFMVRDAVWDEIGLVAGTLENEERRLVLIGEARARCGLVGEADAALQLFHAEEHDERAAAHASEKVERPAVLPPDVDGVADRTSTSLDAALLSSSCSRSPSEEAFVFAELEDEADDGRWALLRSESAEFGALLAAHSCVVSEEAARIALTEDARLGLASLKHDALRDEARLVGEVLEAAGRRCVLIVEAEARCSLAQWEEFVTATACESASRRVVAVEEQEGWVAAQGLEEEARPVALPPDNGSLRSSLGPRSPSISATDSVDLERPHGSDSRSASCGSGASGSALEPRPPSPFVPSPRRPESLMASTTRSFSVQPDSPPASPTSAAHLPLPQSTPVVYPKDTAAAEGPRAQPPPAPTPRPASLLSSTTTLHSAFRGRSVSCPRDDGPRQEPCPGPLMTPTKSPQVDALDVASDFVPFDDSRCGSRSPQEVGPQEASSAVLLRPIAGPRRPVYLLRFGLRLSDGVRPTGQAGSLSPPLRPTAVAKGQTQRLQQSTAAVPAAAPHRPQLSTTVTAGLPEPALPDGRYHCLRVVSAASPVYPMVRAGDIIATINGAEVGSLADANAFLQQGTDDTPHGPPPTFVFGLHRPPRYEHVVAAVRPMWIRARGRRPSDLSEAQLISSAHSSARGSVVDPG